MIINIRGTHGSGKSTVVKTLLDRCPHETLTTEDDKKILGYRLTLPWPDSPLYVVGSYKNACGGCDGIQPYSLIWPRVLEYARFGHVLFEGALVSNSYGTIGEASEGLGNQFVFAFLDTPPEECLRRIGERRKAKGNVKPLNPHHCLRIHKSNAVVMGKCRAKGRRVVVLDHRKPVPQLLGVLRAG